MAAQRETAYQAGRSLTSRAGLHPRNKRPSGLAAWGGGLIAPGTEIRGVLEKIGWKCGLMAIRLNT
jgi:hypothetical protein